MMLEQIKEVRDSIVEDLAKQVEINNETNAEKLQSELSYLLHLIHTKLTPKVNELPRWKSQVDFLLKQLNQQVSLKESCEQQLTKERKEVKKLQQNLKYIEDQYQMKKMQDKSSKMKASGMRGTMNNAIADRVKRASFKGAAGAGARPAISVTEVGSNDK